MGCKRIPLPEIQTQIYHKEIIMRRSPKTLQAQIAAVKAEIEKAKLAKLCLLYTSPSPRDGLLSRMPSSA